MQEMHYKKYDCPFYKMFFTQIVVIKKYKF